jgi:hypothetical protein
MNWIGKAALCRSSSAALQLSSRHMSRRTNNAVLKLRSFSSVAPTQTETGFIEKPLKALDMSVVRQIKAELMEGKKLSV